MSNIDFEKFTWFTPKPKSLLAITIPNPDRLNLNPELLTQMPSHIEFGVSKNGQEICIRERLNGGYKIPRNGSIKDSSLISVLTSMGVRLPARYTVQKEDNCWLAIMDEPLQRKVIMKKPPRKPRNSDLHNLTKEIELL